MQKEFGINKYMKDFLKNPLTLWILWYFSSRRILMKNRNNHLRIGYMTKIVNVKIGNYNTFYNNVMVADSIIDDYVYIANRTEVMNATIGKFCSIGQDVKIGLGIHPTHFISTFPAFFSTKGQCQITFSKSNIYEEIGYVIIGNDVWIGANVIILPNVTVGDGAIIGAGAVVTKNVEPYSIVGGVPARLIKKRFSDLEITKLLQIKWWNKDISWIRVNQAYFTNINEFFNRTF